MWVFTTGGFVSAVEHRDDKDKVMVRARDKQSLQTMIEGIELAGAAAGDDLTGLEIVKKTPSDYPWRVEMLKATFALFLVHETMNYLNYHNFKNGLTETRGEKWHKAAMNVWVDMLAVSDTKEGTNYGTNDHWNGGSGGYAGLAAWEERAVDEGLAESYAELMDGFVEPTDEELAEADAIAYQERLDSSLGSEDAYGLDYHPLGLQKRIDNVIYDAEEATDEAKTPSKVPTPKDVHEIHTDKKKD